MHVSSLLLAWLACAATSNASKCADSLTVKTTSGTFTGFINRTTPDVRTWLGIPYGKPPVGSRRFMAPEAAEYQGAADAKAYKPICMQPSPQNSTKRGIFWELVPEFQNQDAQSEDCLYLNVWAPPREPAKKVPVIIWACGGGFQEGGGHAPYQVPDHWIQRMKTHIVIAFNHRLNAFGFPNARAAPVNVGMLDARLLVEWARDNVAAFGGDPSRITLWGQSAGGALAASYGYANYKDPIVTGIIAQSGASPLSSYAPAGNFTDLAAKLGCANSDAAAELACMQKVDATAIQQGVKGSLWWAAVDNVTVFANNTERLEKGMVAKIPMITGHTTNEAAAFGSFTLNQTGPPADTPTIGAAIACGVEWEYEARVKYGLPTYRYLFAGNFSNITPRWWLGAMHSSDLPIVFGTHFLFRGNSTNLEWQTSYAEEDYWATFAINPGRDPISKSAGLVWPKYSPGGSGKAMVFGQGNGAHLRLSKDIPDIYNCTGMAS